MAVTQNGGHMTHVTTTANRNIKGAVTLRTGTPGGAPAQSVESHLQAAFPSSPLWNGQSYDAEHVSPYKYKLLTNTVVTADTADCAAYWGFSTAVSEADSVPNASSCDLLWTGAPNLDADPGTDTAGNNVASNFMPNLLVPDIDTPTTDVTESVVGTASTPFGVGNGLANPSMTQASIQTVIVTSQENGNVPIPGGPTPQAPVGGAGVRTPEPSES